MSRDTDPRVLREYRRRLLALPAAERVRMACGMFQAAKELALADLRRSGLHGANLRAALFLRLYGSDFPPEERDRIAARLAQAAA